jgi:SAM-dependent methyltransferase
MTEGTMHIPADEGQRAWLHRHPRRPTVVLDRIQWIATAGRARDVAHLGFADIGCELTRSEDDTWLHAWLAKEAARLVGLDVAPHAVAAAKREGYDAYRVDCTSRDAIRRLALNPFDVVIAGEIIEHVDNVGGMLEAAAELLKPDGQLIVSTPNARRLMDLLLALGGREIVHPDHVTLFSVRTLLALLDRHGWIVDEVLVYLNPRPTRGARTLKERVLRAGSYFQRLLVSTTSPYVADGLIVLARRQC